MPLFELNGFKMKYQFTIGDMGGYPIEFTITNKPDKGELSALYKNVNYGTTMKMIGESLPAQGGEISFFGEENG